MHVAPGIKSTAARSLLARCRSNLLERSDSCQEVIVGYRNYDAGFSCASMSKLLPVIVTTGQPPRGRGQTPCARLLYPYAARSLTSADVADLAQWAQQKKRLPTSRHSYQIRRTYRGAPPLTQIPPMVFA